MRFVFALLAAAAVSSLTTRDAAAQTSIGNTYKVEVEYWFFDTDYYYWSTKLETQDYEEALDYYEELLAADQAGLLNSVVPASYWRYIAVDVRMVTVRPQLFVNPVMYQRPAYYRLRTRN